MPNRECGAPALVAIGLGGNQGHTEDLFREAIRTLSGAITDIEVAPIYHSTAVSPIPQPDFLNTVILGRSRLEAEDLLALCKSIERSAGRRPSARGAPRPLDLDLLLWGDRTSDLPELTLPHPRLHQRRFVLQPLCDLMPALTISGGSASVRQLLTTLEDRDAADGDLLERLVW